MSKPSEEAAPPDDHASDIPPRLMQLLVAIVITVALIGYFTGTRRSDGSREPEFDVAASPSPSTARPADDTAALAPRNVDLASDTTRRTDARQAASFARLLADRRSLDAPVELSDGDRERDLRERATRRAYDGAPPRIPHAIAQMTRPDCLGCHEQGLRVAGHVAPAMSHEPFPNCAQCHVVDLAPMPGGAAGLESDPPWATTFTGLDAPERGPRVWDEAPPVIPHPTRMRERCTSCHGVLAEGLATSHPWRQSCTQCHAPSARFDQMPSGGADAPVGGEL